ncbi:MAG: AAA family ATPase [Candidatus Polarisedimenticolaceae bacterium]|nr:AAA family ATPase [Candidatus Polarisedimenticolaceae bacterium]
MLRITLVNTKGGCGKTTIATSLASYFASTGLRTTLMDYDPQGSSRRWLELRESDLPAIKSIDAVRQKSGLTRSWQMHAGFDTEVLVVDTPAGTSSSRMTELLRQTDVVLIPVMQSVIDMQATADFIEQLMRVGKVSSQKKRMGIIANRIRPEARSYKRLEQFLEGYDLPVVASIHDSQNYVNAMEQGQGIHEYHSESIAKDREQWSSLIEWLNAPPPKVTPIQKLRAASSPSLESAVSY